MQAIKALAQFGFDGFDLVLTPVEVHAQGAVALAGGDAGAINLGNDLVEEAALVYGGQEVI